MTAPIPVTLATGFLGSGKTTLVNRILAERGEEKIAVIENGFGKVSIDHALLAHEAEIVEINDGCVCCSVREQVAFADVLPIGKRDRADEKQFSGLLRRRIRINPRAVIHAMSHGDVPMHAIVDVNAFNLTSLLEVDPGFLGAGKNRAGGACRHGAAGYWRDAVPQEHWPQDDACRTQIAAKSQGEWGDRRQELVFIGMDMNETDIRAKLDACLLTDAEMARGRAGWVKLDDPFPVWAQDAPEDIETELT